MFRRTPGITKHKMNENNRNQHYPHNSKLLFPEKDNQTHRDKNEIENRIKRKYRKLYLRSETVCFIHTVITGQCG